MNPIAANTDSIQWINFDAYSVTDLVLIFAGTLLWVVAYIIIIIRGLKFKFVEMPVAAGASNIAWEFVWGFLFVTDLGALFVWGLRIWFFLDVFIFFTIMRYGRKQIVNPILKANFPWIEAALVTAWSFIFWAFIKEGYDTQMGATSAYAITIIMGWVYITTFMNNNPSYFSIHVAWTKGLGNLLMSVFVFIHYEGMWFLKIMAIIVTVLDTAYFIMVLQSLLKRAKAPAPVRS